MVVILSDVLYVHIMMVGCNIGNVSILCDHLMQKRYWEAMVLPTKRSLFQLLTSAHSTWRRYTATFTRGYWLVAKNIQVLSDCVNFWLHMNGCSTEMQFDVWLYRIKYRIWCNLTWSDRAVRTASWQLQEDSGNVLSNINDCWFRILDLANILMAFVAVHDSFRWQWQVWPHHQQQSQCDERIWRRTERHTGEGRVVTRYRYVAMLINNHSSLLMVKHLKEWLRVKHVKERLRKIVFDRGLSNKSGKPGWPRLESSDVRIRYLTLAVISIKLHDNVHTWLCTYFASKWPVAALPEVTVSWQQSSGVGRMLNHWTWCVCWAWHVC